MDESDDSKIRRNLVVFSALIILLAWLRIPVGEIAAGLLKLDKLSQPIQISQFRLWVACFAVLLYLSLRYRFTKEWKEIGNTYRSNVRDKTRKLIDKRTVKSMARFTKTKQKDGGFKGQLFTFYNATVAAKKQKYGDQIGEPEVLIGLTGSGYTMNGGKVKIILRWDAKLVGGMAEDSSELVYTFDWFEHKWMTFYANAYTFVYSPSAVQYIIPSVLAVVAFAVVLIKLIQSF